MMTPKVLAHADGAIYCDHKKDGTYQITLSDKDHPEPVVTARHGPLQWIPAVIVAGKLTDTISPWPEEV